MHLSLSLAAMVLGAWDVPPWLNTSWMAIKVVIGFSIIIFVHELGHFLAAKWCGVRVDRFAIGFGTRLFGWRKGEGLTFGNRPNYKPEELKARNYGETDYCFKLLPLGGYVKMLGQDDIDINEQTGEIKLTDDPRAFTSRPVGQRMAIVSAGVVFNVLFAALLFIVVFLIGRPMLAPVIGRVMPESPAEEAGLHPGDRFLAINGGKVDSYWDIRQTEVLADKPIRVTVQRGDRVLPELVVTPKYSPVQRLQTIGIEPMLTTKLQADGDQIGELPAPKAGDRIVEVDGQPVSNGQDLMRIFQRSHGRVLKTIVERPDPTQPGAPPARLETFQRAEIAIAPAVAADEQVERLRDRQHLLGLVPRSVVGAVTPGLPAERGGLRSGDVMLRWANLANPLHREIVDSIQVNIGKPVPVTVERDGNPVQLTIVPEKPFRVWGAVPARIGAEFRASGDSDRVVVADVAERTPAAALSLSRGAEILEVAGKPVNDWYDMVEVLQASAGRTVSVRYRSGTDVSEEQLVVPSSLVNELDLPPDVVILSIDNQESVKLAGGKELRLPTQSALVVRAVLADKIGQTVNVRYTTFGANAPPIVKPFSVRADNIDPWQMRVQYLYDPQVFAPLTEPVHANGDPLKAMWMGMKVTWFTVSNTYQTFKQMAKQNVSVEHVSGPVGIIGYAMEQARLGWVDLLFFLAFLSVNLAVINFLPLPVVDGGQMVFLIIEKIKGKPLSLKVQMVSMIVGLALIALCFILVTIQDVTRLFG